MAPGSVSRQACLALASSLLLGCAALHPESKEPLVDIRDVAAGIAVNMPYATEHNFTKNVVYPVNRCLLRTTVAKRLALVQADLALQGLGLKVWDCYRPLSIQRKFWALVPNPDYVADPKKGSRHNRGAAVDVTLVDSTGQELPMPTGFDDFSPKAHRDYMAASDAALRNRSRLETAMTGHGFVGLKTEWWHFDASGWERYPLLDVPLTSVPSIDRH